MRVVDKLLIVLLTGFSVAAFVSQGSAQPDTQLPPRAQTGSALSAHREAALRKCTDGVRFASDRYVACMTAEGEEP
jgi:hypothetical protein